MLDIKSLFWILPDGLKKYYFKTFNKSQYNRFSQLFTGNNADGISWEKMKELKFIFIHIPKTGGLSLSNKLLSRSHNHHLMAKRFQLFLTKNEFKNYFKFAIVRNPWDRLVSAYLFLKKGGINALDEKFNTEELAKYESFDSFVKNYLTQKPNLKGVYVHFMPQYKFVTDHRNKVIVDYIGRFENYADSCNYIFNRLGMNETEVEKVNANSNRLPYKAYYNEETKNIVAEIYKKDIELLGYTF